MELTDIFLELNQARKSHGKVPENFHRKQNRVTTPVNILRDLQETAPAVFLEIEIEYFPVD